MKKLLGLLLVALFVPSLASAAFNDVTLAADTSITVGEVTLTVSDTASVPSIQVTADSVVITLVKGADISVTSAGKRKLTVSSLPAGVSSTFTCRSADSLLSLFSSSEDTSTVTVTVESTTCSASGGGPVSGGGGGGGGGGGSSTAAPVPAPVPAAPALVPVSGLTVTQVEAILSLLSSFSAGEAALASVKAVLYGQSSAGSGSSAPATFSRNLEVGMTGEDVKALQIWLNQNGYPVASSGPGSLGNETTKFGSATKAALIKFQKDKGITPAAGYFGPKTRAAIK